MADAISPAATATLFQANLSASPVVSNTTTTSSTGVAIFELSDNQTRLCYTLTLDGSDLGPVQANRIDPDDANKIHLQSAPMGSPGPHVLNIFGLPSEEDNQLIIDDAAESLSGEWDDADAINSATDTLFDQSMSGTTKLLSNFIDELLAGEVYLAVHTLEANGDVAIRGQLNQIPEPTTLLLAGLCCVLHLPHRLRRSVEPGC